MKQNRVKILLAISLALGILWLGIILNQQKSKAEYALKIERENYSTITTLIAQVPKGAPVTADIQDLFQFSTRLSDKLKLSHALNKIQPLAGEGGSISAIDLEYINLSLEQAGALLQEISIQKSLHINRLSIITTQNKLLDVAVSLAKV